MRKESKWGLTRRLTFLAALGLCLASLTLPWNAGAFEVLCTTCDENFYTCRISGQLYETCRQEYEDCLNFCTYRDPSGGGGSGGSTCGRGRTVCEQSCYNQKQDCVANGGETCGEEYQTCMQGCCPS